MNVYVKGKYSGRDVVVLAFGLIEKGFRACILDEGNKRLLTTKVTELEDVEMVALQQLDDIGGGIDGQGKADSD